ncbi:MAG: hypothetical protein Q8Q52_04560, partial [Acidimicrobiia bacterium]|nr:hypothetical protein [Acidimicrobiia bacterium]
MKPKLLLLHGALVLAACNPTVSSTSTAGEPTTSTESGPTTTASGSSTSSATTLPGGTEELPAELRAEIARLIGVTEDLRGHTFTTAPTITVLSSEELAQRVRQQVEEDYEDVDVDEALYKLLGLVEPDFDLRSTISDLYGEQVAGFYDGETGELVVPAREDDFSTLQQVTLVHELTHALTDQALDFHSYFTGLHDAERFDESSAYQALIEGDASMTEILFVQQMSPAEQQEFLTEAFQEVDGTVYAGVPQFIQAGLIFPYEAGFAFVSELFESQGFAAVDEAYSNPPRSTEQILDPRKYLEDQPVAVTVPENPLEGYELAYGSTWGELGFRLMFDQEIGGDDAATEGWGGDDYAIYFNGTEAAMILTYVGDLESDADELSSALGEFIGEAMNVEAPTVDGSGSVFLGEDYSFLSQVGDRVAWVVAGDPGVGVGRH